MRYALLLSLIASPLPVGAQNVPQPARPIQDNSFLIEEAYNQEKRVVQHILVAERSRGSVTGFEFTQEWPLRGLRHQLSYSVPFELSEGISVGDAMINYRYQLRGDGDAIIAVAPRISLILPTSGTGGEPALLAFEAMMPSSIVIARQLVTHSNFGASVGQLIDPQPASDGADLGGKMTTVMLGQSVVWLAHPNLNFLIEALWQRSDFDPRSSFRARNSSTEATLAPGLRGAFNLASGMQIVPGFAIPFGIGPSSGERSVFLYLSVEHSF